MKRSTPFIAVIFLVLSHFLAIETYADGRAVPIAGFQADLTMIPVGGSINFTDTSTGAPTVWEWIFEGGTPSSFYGQLPPAIDYDTAGIYDVKLIVSNEEGSDTLLKTAYINVVAYPDGWDYVQTGTSHLISIPQTVSFYNRPLGYGDFIGVFYLDENGDEKCGGANVWDTTNNIAVVAFGDDATTPGIKEGFAEGEPFVWKVFFSDSVVEKQAFVLYNEVLPNHDGKFYDNGLSAVTSIDTDPLLVNASANPEGICLGDTVQLDAEASGGTGTYSYSWSSSPAGFTSELRNPQASPSQSTTYYISVDDGNRVVTDSVFVEIISPSANAGDNQTVCETDTVSLSGTATHYLAVLWSSSGDGTFTGQNQLEATYTPGASDIASGSAELTLTAAPVAPCTVAAISSLAVTVVLTASADAGENMTVCYAEPGAGFLLNGSVENASDILWETAGDGIFNYTNIETPEYTPGAGDLAAGEVALTLTAQSVAPCTYAAADQMLLSFVFLPEVFAGDNDTVCKNTVYPLVNATAQHYSTLSWESAGDGTFDDPAALNPVYTPGTADYENGSVELCLTAQPVDPCTTAATGCMLLSFFSEHQLVIPAGWSGISSYLEPVDADIEVLMAPVADDMVLMYDQQDQVYNPAGGVNEIGDWKTSGGYYIKMENDVVLNICGTPVENKTLNLQPGWNAIPVLSQSDVAVDDIFASLGDKVVIVREIAGTLMWYPAFDISTLETLHAGKAYLVKVTEAVTVTFP